MSTSAPAAPDDVALAGYFDLKLTDSSISSLKFTDISGLTHSISVMGQAVGTSTGGAGDARTVGVPDPITLTMNHVLLTDMSLWTWVEKTVSTRAQDPAEGTLTLNALGTGTVIKSWNLSEVFLTGVMIDAMGASTSHFLTATVTMLVGQCVPSK